MEPYFLEGQIHTAPFLQLTPHCFQCPFTLRYLSSGQHPGCLLDIRVFTTHLQREYTRPIDGCLIDKLYFMEYWHDGFRSPRKLEILGFWNWSWSSDLSLAIQSYVPPSWGEQCLNKSFPWIFQLHLAWKKYTYNFCEIYIIYLGKTNKDRFLGSSSCIWHGKNTPIIFVRYIYNISWKNK